MSNASVAHLRLSGSEGRCDDLAVGPESKRKTGRIPVATNEATVEIREFLQVQAPNRAGHDFETNIARFLRNAIVFKLDRNKPRGLGVYKVAHVLLFNEVHLIRWSPFSPESGSFSLWGRKVLCQCQTRAGEAPAEPLSFGHQP